MITLITYIWLQFFMLLHVNPQASSICKAFITFITFIRFASGMNVKVFLHQIVIINAFFTCPTYIYTDNPLCAYFSARSSNLVFFSGCLSCSCSKYISWLSPTLNLNGLILKQKNTNIFSNRFEC